MSRLPESTALLETWDNYIASPDFYFILARRPSSNSYLTPWETNSPDKAIMRVTLFKSPPKGANKMVPRENCRKVSENSLTLFDDF